MYLEKYNCKTFSEMRYLSLHTKPNQTKLKPKDKLFQKTLIQNYQPKRERKTLSPLIQTNKKPNK